MHQLNVGSELKFSHLHEGREKRSEEHKAFAINK